MYWAIDTLKVQLCTLHTLSAYVYSCLYSHNLLSLHNEWAGWQYFIIIIAVNYCSESDWRVLELRVHAPVRDVVHCDATMDPVVDYPNPAFDSIIITLCLEEDCPMFKALKATIAHAKLEAILKPGDHLIVFSVLGETYYKVEDLV